MGQQLTDDELLRLRVRPIMSEQLTDKLFGLHEQPFTQLVLNLLSNSNAKRLSSEHLLLSFSKNYPQLLCLKTSLLLCSPLRDMRFTAAILLRQFFTPISDFYLWPRLSPFCQFYLRIILLLSLQEEEFRCVANAKSDTIAQLASNLVPLYPQYPELLRFVLVSMATSENQSPILLEANLGIFSQIAKPLANILLPKIPILRSILSFCIAHPTSSDVRVAALSAYCSLVQSLPPSKDRNKLRSLLRFFYSVIHNAVRDEELTIVPKVLKLLIDFAGAEPKFIRDIVKNTALVLSVLNLFKSDKLKEGTRHLALEFVITLAEARKPVSGSKAARCCVLLHVPIISAILEMLFDVGDMAWLNAQSQGKELNQSGSYTFALECLDRLVFALGGDKLLKAAEYLLPSFFSDPDWKKQHVAFISLARISQDCSKEIDSESLFPGIVLSALCAAMDEFENPCLQASAAMALMNFIEICSDDILKPCLHIIVEKLVLLLEKGMQMVQEEAVSALTTVAEAASDQFDKYYDAVMRHLMHILTNATNKKHRMLLAKSADCVIVVGLSAGKDKFSKHVKVVMGVLISLQSSLNPYDPVTNYVLRATATMCEYLEHGFLAYMDSVMKPLLKSVLLKPDFGIASADVQHFDDVGTETARFKGKRMRLRLSILEEKALACNVLFGYVEVLKEHFFPWTEKVALVLAPLIKFKHHVEVRKVSARAMPELLNSAKIAIEEGIYQNHDGLSVKRMFGFMLPTLLESIHKEWDEETCAIILESLNQCLELSARHLKEYQVRNIVEEMKYLITSSDARKSKGEKIKTEDYHGDESKHEDVILALIGECLTVLIKTYKKDFLPFFDELSMYLTPMLVAEDSIQTRTVSLNVFIDLVEECGYAAVRYYDAYLPYLLVACNDDDPTIRQSGVYGVGICAEFGGSEFTPFISEALAKLNNVILSPNALAPDYALAYDNAVSALGKICQFHRFHARAKAIATWLNCLPISHDLEEAEKVHEQLCSMVERSDRQLLGENDKHLIKIISLFIEILSFSQGLATEQTRNRMVKFLNRLKDTMPQSTLCETLSSLSNKHQLAFKSIIKRSILLEPDVPSSRIHIQKS
ncbi:uncharacterized protein LOC144551302 isoform X2 [Carex rostrata]